MVPLAAICLVLFRRVTIESPYIGQLPVAPVVRCQYTARVIAPRHNHTRPHAVQVCNTGKEPVHPVAITVTPQCFQLVFRWLKGVRMPRGYIVRCGKCRTGSSVEDRKVLRAFENVAV